MFKEHGSLEGITGEKLLRNIHDGLGVLMTGDQEEISQNNAQARIESKTERSEPGTKQAAAFNVEIKDEQKHLESQRSENAGNEFKKILSASAQKLSKEEIERVQDVLNERGNPAIVELHSIGTEDLNGKRVLRIVAEYKRKQNDLNEIFVDADGTGRDVQEIYYLAPKSA